MNFSANHPFTSPPPKPELNDKSNDKTDLDGSKVGSKDGNNQVKTHKKSSNKKSSKKQNQRKNLNQRHKSGILTPQQWGQELTSKILATMDKHKEVFFVIRLHYPGSPPALQRIVDPDNLQNCDLMDGRDAFLTLAREKHYEFSSLRRAKFSTMALLYDLHNSGKDCLAGLILGCSLGPRLIALLLLPPAFPSPLPQAMALCIPVTNANGTWSRYASTVPNAMISISACPATRRRVTTTKWSDSSSASSPACSAKTVPARWVAQAVTWTPLTTPHRRPSIAV